MGWNLAIKIQKVKVIRLNANEQTLISKKRIQRVEIKIIKHNNNLKFLVKKTPH